MSLKPNKRPNILPETNVPKIKTDKGSSRSFKFPINMDVNSELNRTKMTLIVNTKTKRIAVKRLFIVFIFSVLITSP